MKLLWPALLVLVVLAGCGSSTPPAPRPTPARGWQNVVRRPSSAGDWAQPLARREAAERTRRRALAAARLSPTVEASLRAARLSGRITVNVETRTRQDWEYYFAYGAGSPSWVSGMTQATAAQALSRGYRALGQTRWKRAAERALGAFEQPPPRGVAVRANSGAHYLLYSFAPSHVVYNGALQAVLGLRDAGALLHSSRARSRAAGATACGSRRAV